MSNLWFTKEQIEAEENAGRFNQPWDERAFRSRILQDWLTMYADIQGFKNVNDYLNRENIDVAKEIGELRSERDAMVEQHQRDIVRIAESLTRAERAEAALKDLYEACMAADADGELDSRIDGEILDAARVVLEKKGGEG